MYPNCHKPLNSALRLASVRVRGDSARGGTSDRLDWTPWEVLSAVDLHANSTAADLSAACDVR